MAPFLNIYETKAGSTPATKIKVSGCSGMALTHSRRPFMAGSRGVRRESHHVIRSAANTACLSADTAMSQASTS